MGCVLGLSHNKDLHLCSVTRMACTCSMVHCCSLQSKN